MQTHWIYSLTHLLLATAYKYIPGGWSIPSLSCHCSSFLFLFFPGPLNTKNFDRVPSCFVDLFFYLSFCISICKLITPERIKMGLEGTLEYLSDLLSRIRKRKKRKQIQTVALKVRMDCEGCERKVKKVLSGVKGTYVSISISNMFCGSCENIR
jgi:hypothetical protein